MNRGGRLGLAVACASAAALAGCGLGPGPGTSDATLTITHRFGSEPVGSPVREQKVPGGETVMRMLARHEHVATRYGGGFVESIGNLSGSSNHFDWFYYVNGVEARHGAAGTRVHRGDRVWFDLHDWSETYTIPAVVGSFPEPFVHGVAGKRYPTALECAGDVASACDQVGAQLRSNHVPVAEQLLGNGSGSDTLSVVVATWSDLRGTLAGELISHGPKHSGIYAQFAQDGTRLELLNPLGQVARVLGPGSGLVAATTDRVSKPEWLITGTDAAGVRAAARELTPARLRDHFAVAVQGSRATAVPLQPGT